MVIVVQGKKIVNYEYGFFVSWDVSSYIKQNRRNMIHLTVLLLLQAVSNYSAAINYNFGPCKNLSGNGLNLGMQFGFHGGYLGISFRLNGSLISFSGENRDQTVTYWACR